MTTPNGDYARFLNQVRRLAVAKHVTAQIMLQEVILDYLLERIAVSKYRDNLVLKGGFLIASLIGTDTRSTRDLDTSIKGLPVSEDKMLKVFKSICAIDLHDQVSFQINMIKPIHESAEYIGYRLSLQASILNHPSTVKIDITTGDVMTESEITYQHKLLLEDRSISVKAYNTETIIAEKMHSVVELAELNTRLKDYYDLYMLDTVRRDAINFSLLGKAIAATAEYRGGTVKLNNYAKSIEDLSNSSLLKSKWQAYQRKNKFTEDIAFTDTCLAALDLIARTTL